MTLENIFKHFVSYVVRMRVLWQVQKRVRCMRPSMLLIDKHPCRKLWHYELPCGPVKVIHLFLLHVLSSNLALDSMWYREVCSFNCLL